MNAIRKIYSFFLDIFFPKRCVNCKKPCNDFVCLNCVKNIEKVVTPICPGCGKISEFGKYCSGCKRKNKAFLTAIFSSASYENGPIKEMIHHLKYSGITDLSKPLGELMVERLKHNFPKGGFVVVPVPLHKKREFSRGFNQAELLARHVSERLNLPGGCALERVKNTESQVKLSGKMRRINLENAFECLDRELIKGKDILLVDDVATTGATLNECAKILRKNGAKRVWGVVVSQRKS